MEGVFKWKALRCTQGRSLLLASLSSPAKQMLWSSHLSRIHKCTQAPSWQVPGRAAGGRHLCSAGLWLVLPGPGEEGDQPPGGEGAEGAEQEDPGGQSTGAAEGGGAVGLSTWGQEAFSHRGPGLVCPCLSQTGPDWLSWKVQETLALGAAGLRDSGSVFSEPLLSTSALLASGRYSQALLSQGLSEISGIPGPIPVPRAGGLGTGMGYSPSPNPRGPRGLRGHGVGSTGTPSSNRLTFIFSVHSSGEAAEAGAGAGKGHA